MRVGASSACFFPLETEKALDEVLRLGFKTAEVFFNTSSELEEPFVRELRKNVDDHDAKILSVHPFSSSLESNCIFAEYSRRFDDFIGLYQKHFHAAAMLGADIVVIHGSVAKQKRDLSDEFYFDRFQKLVDLGKREGVRVCQENVVRFRSQDVEFLKRMRTALGDDFNMVFDIKQAVRSGYDPFYVLDEFKNDIVHIHLSDNSPEADCMPPGRGCFDFKRLFDSMRQSNYNGGYVIEIYSKGYNVAEELKLSKNYLENL
ncbi:sugar phosphate isomerase/epimerase [uncultured Eubacterium sp.]|uniref:sugar phosphate isomerase/epimerase family protein n=1 Tax=uncultured Eubacterium sp. TaxID=165185 RepID=UPI0015B1EB35|nr:sugar phosphate isomerase/epimerase [uncultured Eubacterium sp.]